MKNEILEFKCLDTFEIEGRGTVKVIENNRDREWYDFDDMSPQVKIDGAIYDVLGIEKFAVNSHSKGEKFGLLVKEPKEKDQ